MSIIIEGPDGSGKSTLAKALSEALGYPITHAGSAPKNEAECFERVTEDVGWWSTGFIQDRSFTISDHVYASVIPDRSVPYDFSFYLKLLATHLNECRTMIIFCDAPDEILLDDGSQIIKPHETQKHIDDMKRNKLELVMEYRRVSHSLGLFAPVITVAPRVNGLAETVELIKEYVENAYVLPKLH